MLHEMLQFPENWSISFLFSTAVISTLHSLVSRTILCVSFVMCNAIGTENIVQRYIVRVNTEINEIYIDRRRAVIFMVYGFDD